MSKFPEAEGIKQTSRVAIISVLVILFALPLLTYLFFLNGEHHFKTLPIVTEKVSSLDGFRNLDGEPIHLKDSVSIVTFLGNQPYKRIGYVSNVNEKIYKDFHEFDGFQMISIFPEAGVKDIEEIKLQMAESTDLNDWHFLVGSDDAINKLFNSFESDLSLNKDLSSEHAFIIDKQMSLRGRNDDPELGMVYGYDTYLIANLNKRMMDDIRVLLAEYRFAFKKNRDEKIQKDER
ncbi:membrane or secreted protein [Nonlabens sp. Asnod3-A02]|uniref:membrane or secreted protein n=1 Tax=Nonlabens sp. Asnod3-A02 TaxID=3160579 RepID=UPI003867D416